jgi:hypothetical protein
MKQTICSNIVGGLMLVFAAVASMQGDDLAYVTTQIGQFGTIDLNTGAYTQISAFGLEGAGLGVAGGRLYTAAYKGSTLYRIDPITGTLTSVGTSAIQYEGFGSTAKGLYALDANTNLYSVDPVTAATQLIGPTGIPHGFLSGGIGISTNAVGLFIAGSDIIYRVETRTGAARPLSEVPYDFRALLLEGGSLWGIAGCGDCTLQVFTIEPLTGGVTFMANVSGNPAPYVANGLAPLADGMSVGHASGLPDAPLHMSSSVW